MNTILVPLDGSALAEQVLPYVRTLAPLLGAGVRLAGPAILIQHNSTTLLPPGYTAEVLEYGSLRIARNEGIRP